MKKFLSILLAFILMFTCVFPAFAEGSSSTDTSVTENTDSGEDTEEENNPVKKFLDSILEALQNFIDTIKSFFVKEPEHTFVRGMDEEYHWQVCSDCGKQQFKDTHIFNSGAVKKEPACLVEGEYVYTCVVCGCEKTEAIPSLGHNEVILPAVEPTETEPGLTAGRMCNRCGVITVEQKEISSKS